MRSIAKRLIRSILSSREKQQAKNARDAPINSSFYLEHFSRKGAVITEHMDARKLRAVDDDLYVYGWSEMMPRYCCIPVDSIITLVDDETGDVIPHADVADWLLNRAMH